jgi:hypothetical protein
MACTVAAAAMFTASSVHAAVGKAVVRTIRGTASYSESGGEFKALKVGKVLGPTSTVRTSASSMVDLYLGDNGPTVRLTEDTTLGLDKLDLDNTGSETVIETQLDLKTGTILGYVKKMAAASKYEVKTPIGVAGIRGTEYQISANGTVSVLSGSVMVAVTAADGRVNTYTVNAGQTFTPATTPGGQPTVGPTPPGVEDQIRNNLPTGGIPEGGGGPTRIITTPEPVVVISPINPASEKDSSGQSGQN